MALDPNEFNRFMAEAQIKLIGASETGIKEELFSTMKEFFNETSAWQEVLTINIIPGTQSYTLVPTQGGTLLRLVAVYDPNSIPQPAFMPTFGTMTLTQQYTTPQAFTVVIAKQVVLPTSREGVPDAPVEALRIYDGVLMDGVLGRMKSQANKSFSDPQLGSWHLHRFENGKAMVRTQMLRQNTVGAQSWRFPKSVQTHGQRGGISTNIPTAF